MRVVVLFLGLNEQEEKGSGMCNELKASQFSSLLLCLARTRFSSNSSTGLQNVLVISKIVPSATVFTELLGRILDLDADDWGPTDNQMVITVFQYAAYFLTQGRLVVVKRIT